MIINNHVYYLLHSTTFHAFHHFFVYFKPCNAIIFGMKMHLFISTLYYGLNIMFEPSFLLVEKMSLSAPVSKYF